MNSLDQGREAVWRGETLQQTLGRLSELAEADAPGATAGYTVVDPSGAFVREAIFPSLPGEFQNALAYVPLTEPYLGSCVQSIRTGVPVVSNDILGDMRFDGKWRELCLRFGIKAIRSAPLKAADGEVAGSFVLGYKEPSSDNRWDHGLMAKFAELGLDAIRLYRTLAVTGAR